MATSFVMWLKLSPVLDNNFYCLLIYINFIQNQVLGGGE